MIVEPLSRRFLMVIADLSLILFLVCASALQNTPVAVTAAAATPPVPRDAPIMMAVWREAAGGITLAQWLAEQPPDDSQRLSIEVSYRAGGVETAFGRADALRRSAGAAGANARVLIAESTADEVLAQLVQDDVGDEVGTAIGPDIAMSRSSPAR